jgi:hypothetical protein
MGVETKSHYFLVFQISLPFIFCLTFMKEKYRKILKRLEI